MKMFFKLAFRSLCSELPSLLFVLFLFLALLAVQIEVFKVFARVIADVLQNHCHEVPK